MKGKIGLTGKHFWPDMVLIPAGEFIMGSDPQVDKGAYDNEQPQHTVYLSDYYIAKTPVTNVQYATFIQIAGYRPPWYWKDGQRPERKANHPVTYVSWQDAVAYCEWLSEVTDNLYRLPSEAEWEKGARGTQGLIYPWGNQWEAERGNTEKSGHNDTTPVTDYLSGASLYGLLDMSGNVWEWINNWYRGEYYINSPSENPPGPISGTHKAMRGGSWATSWTFVRAAARSPYDPVSRSSDVGFRCVMTPKP